MTGWPRRVVRRIAAWAERAELARHAGEPLNPEDDPLPVVCPVCLVPYPCPALVRLGKAER